MFWYQTISLEQWIVDTISNNDSVLTFSNITVKFDVDFNYVLDKGRRNFVPYNLGSVFENITPQFQTKYVIFLMFYAILLLI